ncbi:hypothetical protein S-CBP2_0039 [Synechococcus phage S-CBP2]|uniref:Phage tail lysozyme domain-containing protein n=1 Tax=Synechococcus phage S-CBP2 TaxID=756277 RepID=A0A096VL06_9CAUD|nr:hypothetical protein S-CBP2_0039 [Synechococcus phage S-CBP2]AGF91078.1 hypothetical protein SXHG_00056 [Synechococcus phage MRHenn-2013a]AGK86745.1 hypothetical protein S-CBP2_0039 [Synechococcus phage S-CBP2]
MANEHRTVQYRGSDVQRNAYIGVPNGQQALDSDINYQNKQLQRSSEALLQQEAATIRNNERVDRISLSNQRLQLEAMNSRNNAVLKNEQMFGEQQLNNMKLREDQSLQIKQLQIMHQQKSDEFKLLNQRQDTESITRFGVLMLPFSKTLWEQNVKEQDKKAEEMKAHATLDYVLNPNLGEMLRVDQAQYGRLAKQGEASALAAELEKQGLPNDAARIRASNPFYLHTMQEMAALTATNELPDFLNKVVMQAQETGVLTKGDPDFAVKLQAIQYDGLKTFIREKGLTNMNPVVVARYLQGPMLQALAGVSRQYNAENNRVVKEATKSQALGDAMASFSTLTDATEVNKHVSQVYAQGGPEALAELFNGITAQADLLGDNAPVVSLMQHPMMAQRFQGQYAKWEERRIQRAEANLRQQNEDNYKLATAQWDLQVGRANPADLPRLREEFLSQHEGSLSIERYAALEKHVMGTKAVDAGHLQTRVDDVISLGDERDIAQALKNPAITNEMKAQLQKAAQARQKEMDPQAQQALKSAQNLVLGKPLEGLKKQYNTAVNPLFTKQIDAVIKERQDELARRTRIYWAQPNATIEGYQDWLATKNKDLLEAPIQVDQHGRVLELGKMSQVPERTKTIPPTAVVPYKGRNVVWMTESSTREALLKGSYGHINSQQVVVVSPQEVVAIDAQYARTGVYPPEFLALAVRARVRPDELLAHQAAIHGMGGSPSLAPVRSKPGDATTGVSAPGAPLSRATAQQMALSAGLSPRGAIWLATNMMDESSGKPTAVHDGGDGYGLFGHQGGRLENMKAYAAAKGKDISDGTMQVQFALDEIRTRYPEVWRTVTAPNPSLNDLWRASKAWEGFHHSVYEHRFNSLRTALGE